jgi:hypothetical protein
VLVATGSLVGIDWLEKVAMDGDRSRLKSKKERITR